MLSEQVYEQAALLASPLEEKQEKLLMLLCQSVVCALRTRLREGMTEEDCRAEFVASASLLALADLQEAEQLGTMAEFRAGDLTVKNREAGSATRCLRNQAELIMAPFLKDTFAFQVV